MFAKRAFAAALSLPCSLGLQTSFSSKFAYCEDDKRIHQPSFRAHNTRTQPKKAQHHHPHVSLDSMTLISGTGHKDLAEKIAKEINVPLCDASISRFADGEVSVQINDNIRGNDVYIVQTCSAPVNDSIMELLLMVSCARRSNVRRVIAVIPYFGYKHHRRGNAISTRHNSRFLWSGAGDFAAMLQEMGVDQVITVDLQRPGQGLESSFFDNTVPVETIITTDLFMQYFTKDVTLNEPITVVAPNAECYNKARKFQAQLKKHYKKDVKVVAFFSMDTGSGPADAEQLKTFNRLEVDSGDVIIVDDMVDSAGTVQSLSHRIKEAGAKNIYIAASHGLFTDNAMEFIDKSPVTRVVVTDSLPLPKNASPKIHQVSIAKFLANVMMTEHFRSVLDEEEEYEEED